ncbi:MAG TPA: AAA family ATPase, partial [Pseudomonadaceae bacterium]|nr:AAA family ATPase [Pseudomonadaceae bacterium]
MRIQRLNLAAFGHFTERVLVFDEPGLHIIHGSNEAGKSSALRGLKALLYGIDERTLDNFLHANDKLRIHGVLRTADGQELDFVRRKGRKNTLLTPGGEALGAEVLAPFLQGVTAELFATLFGIDHRALVQGGQEILAQQGEVGQALFSAALGSPALHKVLAELEETAKGLFLPSASKPTINAAIRAHAELRTGIRKISLSSTTWNDHLRILAATTRELEKIESQLSDKRLELTRLQRIQRILPKLARRRELNQELAALGDVRILAEDLGSRRLTALNMLETAETIFNKATARLGGLQEQREGLTVNEALLGQADSIEALYARLDSYRKALQNRPRLVAESQQLHIKGARILNEARPDLSLGDVGPLRSVLARRQQLTELATEQVSLHSREEQAQRSLNDINKRLDEARKEHAAIEEPGSTAGLRRAIAAARKQGDLDSLIQSTQHGITRLRSDCDTALARLGLWQGALEAVPVLALPGRESIQRFEDADDELLERSRRLEDKRDELSKALADASRRLAEIEGAGEVPTEAALSSARSARDGVWQLLRRQWLDGEDVSAEADAHQAEGLPLPEVFEQRLAGADELSDRLRREAERVHA